MNEYLEFISAHAMMDDLLRARAMTMQALQTPQHKGDINLTGQLNRIQNDIQQLDRVLTSTGFNILTGFTTKYGCSFKFLQVKPKLSAEE